MIEDESTKLTVASATQVKARGMELGIETVDGTGHLTERPHWLRPRNSIALTCADAQHVARRQPAAERLSQFRGIMLRAAKRSKVGFRSRLRVRAVGLRN
jgi:hypothetical protein